MTSNIRFENPSDGLNNWPNRKGIWSEIIKNNKVTILCTQEGRKNQLLDANSCINLDLIHGHREWIPERMYPCIFIDKNIFTLIESGDFWLSETPHVAGSKSFQSAFPRLCTWVLLKKDEFSFYVFCCHLDHILDSTRHEQSKVLSEQITKINSQSLPFVLAGDFNESPNGNVRSHIDKNLILKDPVALNDENNQGTHHRFDGDNTKTSRIDWILHTEKFKSSDYRIIKDSKNGIYPSDHFPVVTRLTI